MDGTAARRLARLSHLAAEAQALGPEVDAIADVLARSLAGGGTCMVAGNGGSMAQALHFAEECTGRFRDDRPPLAVLALADPAHLSCTANDFGFDDVFARAVRALGRHGGALLLLSTSGESENLLRAARAGRDSGMATLAFTGRGGGRLAGQVDLCADFPGDTADEVQELHMAALHAIVERIEAHRPWEALA